MGTKFRHLCERHQQGFASTFFSTAPTYQGHGHNSYVDIWCFSVSCLSSVKKYKTHPRLAAKFHGITSKTTDHIPVFVEFEFEFVQPDPNQRFKWGREAMMSSMNNLSCPKRRQFIELVESDLSECRGQWRELWSETTTDPMWDFLNQIVSKHARAIFFHEGHRNALYSQLDAERNALIQQRFRG